jgi:hypothetical protein
VTPGVAKQRTCRDADGQPPDIYFFFYIKHYMLYEYTMAKPVLTIDGWECAPEDGTSIKIPTLKIIMNGVMSNNNYIVAKFIDEVDVTKFINCCNACNIAYADLKKYLQLKKKYVYGDLNQILLTTSKHSDNDMFDLFYNRIDELQREHAVSNRQDTYKQSCLKEKMTTDDIATEQQSRLEYVQKQIADMAKNLKEETTSAEVFQQKLKVL